MRKPFSLSLLVCMLITCSASVVLAQAPPPSTNPPGAPLDVIVSILLAGGIGYGSYRIKKNPNR